MQDLLHVQSAGHLDESDLEFGEGTVSHWHRFRAGRRLVSKSFDEGNTLAIVPAIDPCVSYLIVVPLSPFPQGGVPDTACQLVTLFAAYRVGYFLLGLWSGCCIIRGRLPPVDV